MKTLKLIPALVLSMMIALHSGASVSKSANILDESTGLLTGEQGKNKPTKNQPAKGEKKLDPQKGQPDKKQNPAKSQEKVQKGQKPKDQGKDQNGKQNKGGQKPNDKADKGNQKGNAGNMKDHPGGMKGNKIVFKPKGPKYNFKHPYNYGNPGRWYAYGNSGFYTGRDFGQYRAEMARNKHKKFIPVYEYQVIQVYNVILERNVFLINQMDYKIVYLRTKLVEKRDAGLITVDVYENYMDRVVLLERQRSGLQLSLNVYI